jgi:hypothetical protein
MAGQLLALDLRQQSIPLVLIHPGAVATGMYQRYWEAAHSGGDGSSEQGGPGGMAVSAHGVISTEAAATGVLQRLDELRLEQTGQFVQATTGEVLPW